jgi:hypothetical protein
MILASKHSYTFADNKTIQHENNYRYFIIFQHEFAFLQNSKLTGTIAAKNTEKIAFATVAVLMLLQSRLLNQPQQMKKDTMKSSH